MIYGGNLRLYQSKVLMGLHEGMRQHPGETFTVMLPRQAGKNEIAAHLVSGLLLAHVRIGGTIVVCAPTLHPQAAISLDRARHLMQVTSRLLPGVDRPKLGESRITVGAASAVFLSGSPMAHVAGHTASIAIIADEAQELDEEWFNRQFRPMAASTGASTIMFGTPWDGETLLERAVERNRKQDAHRGPGVWRLHREVDWETVAQARKAYGRYVRQERERLGANHPLFLSQYGLVTVREAGRLFTAEALAALQGEHRLLAGPAGGERYVAGLDFGGDGAGADATVLTIARADGERTEVVAFVAWQGAGYEMLEAGVLAEARRWRVERLVADATGLGAPLAARLQDALGERVVERFVFTAASKSEAGYALLSAANTRRLLLPLMDGSEAVRRCLAELAACRAGYRVSRRLWWEAPPGGHDDHVASLVLCLRAAESLGPARIARGRFSE